MRSSRAFRANWGLQLVRCLMGLKPELGLSPVGLSLTWRLLRERIHQFHEVALVLKQGQQLCR